MSESHSRGGAHPPEEVAESPDVGDPAAEEHEGLLLPVVAVLGLTDGREVKSGLGK